MKSNAFNSSRRFFISGLGSGALAYAIPTVLPSNGHMLHSNDDLSEHYPSTDLADIRAVVGASHANFDKVKELVGARPELAKATYDWGFGDVESALGAASHMGRKDIADFLMEHGARADIFALAMLGKVEAVQAMIEAIPGIQRTLGPHGFTLMHHAQMRLRRENVSGEEKKQQERLVAYLESLGDADIKATSLDITEAEKQVYIGKYPITDTDLFEIKLNSRQQLSIARGDQFGRALLRVGDHDFAPGGAPSVRIRFDVENDKAISLTILDPGPVITVIRA
ncbi:MAG: hypothetical protein KTR24_07165 [Saprospiraceae bacterium]|nr:hypothetical protein [Saprospiraceae bacterium]